MDVTRNNFMGNLGLMLRALSRAHFVAIDMEFSGIQSKVIHRQKPATSAFKSNKQTLQERYEETKVAAERYQVLQIGLTFVREDSESGKYIISPFNMFLNPIFTERLDIERIFSYQSGAVEFLMNHGFRMDGPFLHGVSYLSRVEEKLAREMEEAREKKTHLTDIILGEEDHEAIAFLRRVRQEITDWKDGKSAYPADYMNISAHDSTNGVSTNGSASTNGQGMNNFQKRLVHQLVRAEFPEYVTISRGTFVQLLPLDREREDGFARARKTAFEERLSRQIGLRWLVEGMTGGDLSALNPLGLITNPTDEPVWINVAEVKETFAKTTERIAKNGTILVGHNVFTDLVNFFQCFFGELPDRVEDFQNRVHEVFPLVIDTKYMATADHIISHAKSGLEDLDAELSTVKEPVIEMHERHKAYDTATPIHEAGYDSYITAKVAIRLSAILEASEREASKSKTAKPLVAPMDVLSAAQDPRQQASLSAGGATLVQPIKPRNDPAERSLANTKAPSKFSHPGRFDRLNDGPMDETSTEDDEDDGINGVPLQELNLILDWDEQVVKSPLNTAPLPTKAAEEKTPIRMPPFHSSFWKVYGNKLRINGTIEGFCDLSSGPKNGQ